MEVVLDLLVLARVARARVDAAVQVTAVAEPVPERQDRAAMVGVGGSNESVVADVQLGPQVFEGGSYLCDLLLG